VNANWSVRACSDVSARNILSAVVSVFVITLVALIVAGVPRLLAAQEHPRTVPELRVDATSARVSRLELSGGAVVPIGIYARLALTAGGGMAREHDLTHAVGRADAIARFELDPLKQHSHSAYLGGGLSLLGTSGPHVRAWLALVGGFEMKQRRGWVPSVELGLGGGARVAVSLRRAMESWR
jgi:hypothetical protein